MINVVGNAPASARDGKDRRDEEMRDDILPNLEKLPDLIIYSRSNTFYWWPIWLFGFIAAIITYFGGVRFATETGRELLIHPNPALGLTFLVVLAVVLTFTNVTLRGGYSVFAILVAALILVTLGWLGLLEDVFDLLPQASVYMNFGFYVILSTLIFAIWALRFFIFDRLKYWQIRPGQLVEHEVIGGSEESYDTRGMLFEERSDDFFRHYLLGLGTGDLMLHTSGARKTEIYIPNVLFVHDKVLRMQQLINIHPDEAIARME